MRPWEEVSLLLPEAVRRALAALPQGDLEGLEEVRLRWGRPPTAVVAGGERVLEGCSAVDTETLERTVEIATLASAHTALERVRQGYFTVRGGHRLGLCGAVDWVDGQAGNLRELSSLNVRVARQALGCGRAVYEKLGRGAFQSGVLLLGPPGSGKTTLLRDLIRLCSEDGLRVGLADERGEVAGGVPPRFDVGPRTDVMEGCPKAEGLLMLLRGMTPQVLACDEITAPADALALEQCAHCGTGLLATAHAGDQRALEERGLYARLVEKKLFRWAVWVDRQAGCRVEELVC